MTSAQMDPRADVGVGIPECSRTGCSNEGLFRPVLVVPRPEGEPLALRLPVLLCWDHAFTGDPAALLGAHGLSMLASEMALRQYHEQFEWARARIELRWEHPLRVAAA